MLNCLRSVFCFLCDRVGPEVEREEKDPLLNRQYRGDNGSCEQCPEQDGAPICSAESGCQIISHSQESYQMITDNSQPLQSSDEQGTLKSGDNKHASSAVFPKNKTESATCRNRKIRKCRKELTAFPEIQKRVKRAKSLPSNTSLKSGISEASHYDDIKPCSQNASGDLPPWHAQSHHLLRTLVTPVDSDVYMMANAPLWRQLEDINLPKDDRPPWIN